MHDGGGVPGLDVFGPSIMAFGAANDSLTANRFPPDAGGPLLTELLGKFPNTPVNQIESAQI